jgi:Leucine rich repeat
MYVYAHMHASSSLPLSTGSASAQWLNGDSLDTVLLVLTTAGKCGGNPYAYLIDPTQLLSGPRLGSSSSGVQLASSAGLSSSGTGFTSSCAEPAGVVGSEGVCLGSLSEFLSTLEPDAISVVENLAAMHSYVRLRDELTALARSWAEAQDRFSNTLREEKKEHSRQLARYRREQRKKSKSKKTPALGDKRKSAPPAEAEAGEPDSKKRNVKAHMQEAAPAALVEVAGGGDVNPSTQVAGGGDANPSTQPKDAEKETAQQEADGGAARGGERAAASVDVKGKAEVVAAVKEGQRGTAQEDVKERKDGEEREEFDEEYHESKLIAELRQKAEALAAKKERFFDSLANRLADADQERLSAAEQAAPMDLSAEHDSAASSPAGTAAVGASASMPAMRSSPSTGTTDTTGIAGTTSSSRGIAASVGEEVSGSSSASGRKAAATQQRDTVAAAKHALAALVAQCRLAWDSAVAEARGESSGDNRVALHLTGQGLKEISSMELHAVVPPESSISSVNLSSNQLERLPLDEKLLTLVESVEGVVVAGNRLDSLPAQLFAHLKRVVLLDASVNHLESVPAELSQHLSQLIFLNLSFNRISTLPDNFGVHQLQHISLDHNRLTTFPVSVCKCVNLLVLTLSGNQLENLPDEFLFVFFFVFFVFFFVFLYLP